MSASDPNSKIDLLDPPDVVTRKIKKAVAVPKEVENNGLLAFVRHVLLPASSLLDGERKFTIERQGSDPLIYRDADALEADYATDVVRLVSPLTFDGRLLMHSLIGHASIGMFMNAVKPPIVPSAEY